MPSRKDRFLIKLKPLPLLKIRATIFVIKKQRLENVRENENQSRKTKSSSLDTDADIIPKKKSRWDLPPSDALPSTNTNPSWLAPEKINAPEKRRHSTETGNGNQKPPAISERTTPESGYGTGNSSRLTEFEEEEDRLQDAEELSEHTPYMKMKLGVSMAPPPSSGGHKEQNDTSLDIVKEFTSSTPRVSHDSTTIPGVEEKHEKDILCSNKIVDSSKTVLDGSVTKHPTNVKNDRDPANSPGVKKDDKIL